MTAGVEVGVMTEGVGTGVGEPRAGQNPTSPLNSGPVNSLMCSFNLVDGVGLIFTVVKFFEKFVYLVNSRSSIRPP